MGENEGAGDKNLKGRRETGENCINTTGVTSNLIGLGTPNPNRNISIPLKNPDPKPTLTSVWLAADSVPSSGAKLLFDTYNTDIC